MKRSDRPDAAVLRRLIEYDPQAGKLIWKVRGPDDVPSGLASEASRWNARYAGKPALSAPTNSGYPSGRVMRVSCLAHLVAWAIYYGDWPALEIDHINGIRSDNRIANLREVSRSDNMRNRKVSTLNKSGDMGVYFCKRDKRWIARILHRHVGSFGTKEAALAARIAACAAAGFHQNHGRKSA